MKYIWINPVTERMYEPDVLNDFLCRHGYQRVSVKRDWLSVVKEKYRMSVSEATQPVMDMRCPMIKELLGELDVNSNIVIPEIKPILIHCGQEISERVDLAKEEKIITTPCGALAGMGNAMELPNTTFISWNCFLESIGEKPTCNPPKESPIPPGFYNELGLKTISITGEDDIKAYFQNWKAEEVQLVEMLYCKEGCHNGDGIVSP